MSRRARAVGFAAAALVCAAVAAGMAGGYRTEVADQLGPLRPVVVARESLPAERAIRPQAVARLLEVRRVPSRFVPPGALSVPGEAAGRAPVAPIPAGSYVAASQLVAPESQRRRPPQGIGDGRHPVEIAVAAAGGLAAAPGAARRVDVVVTTEPGPGAGPGRTYVAAEAVRLLDLRSAGGDPGAAALPGPNPASSIATLALTRAEALRLIQAESFARQVRLIPR